MYKPILVAAIFVVVATVACKKDKNEDDKPTAIDLISASSWKIDTVGWDKNSDGEIDEALQPGIFEACDLDNTISFAADSTGFFDEGASKCNAEDEQTTAFTWNFVGANNDTLNINGDLPGELDGQVRVLTLTDANLKMSKHFSLDFPYQFDANLIIALKK
jgi:hypothetical protein